MASVAYKLAMPKMDTKPGIRAAIACIAQGIQLEVFDGRDGSQLLYAAQVALSSHSPKGSARNEHPHPCTSRLQPTHTAPERPKP